MAISILREVERDGRAHWRVYRRPVGVLSADTLESVRPLIEEVEARSRAGFTCVGFVCYEAAPAFDSALECKLRREGLPLAWFALYEDSEIHQHLPPASPFQGLDLRPEVSEESYRSKIAEIRRYIESGDTYQVNYTFRMRAKGGIEPYSLFQDTSCFTATDYAAFIETDDFAICCASPELFFELNGDTVTTIPMKGTAPRGRTSAEDKVIIQGLLASEKERAENLMITDMARNDLGKIATVGTVATTDLFRAEKYATTHQLTSTVFARSNASLGDVFQAMFPAASVTGAPKARTMSLISGLEDSPRGVYTGCIGFAAPGNRARFNVAIRTAVLMKRDGIWEYGVGGGVVWDSTPEGEYAECLVKSRVLTPRREFDLIESLKWSPDGGYSLLQRHLDRLEDSAGYFQFRIDLDLVLLRLKEETKNFPQCDCKVTLSLSSQGNIVVSSVPVSEWQPGRSLLLGVSSKPVDEGDPMLYHKTSLREVYERAKASCEGCDEVLLWNQKGMATEGTFTNLAYRWNGELWTPPASDGLLAGTLRAEMIESGEMKERSLRLEDINEVEDLYVLNSVRGMARVDLVHGEGVGGRADIMESNRADAPLS